MRIKARETAAKAKEIGTALRVCGIWGAMGHVTCSWCHSMLLTMDEPGEPGMPGAIRAMAVAASCRLTRL